MAEKNPENGYSRRDEESSTLQSEELKRKKRIKLATYIAAFVVVKIIVIIVFGLTVMRVKSPKVRLGGIDVQNLNTSSQTSSSSPSFDMSLTTQIKVKNTNFGPYKYDSSSVTFEYQGMTVGQVVIPKGKAGWRSTEKIGATVILSSKALPSSSNLGNELNAGVLTLSSQARLSGKVELMFVMKKNKSAEMNCTITFHLATKGVQALECQ